MRRHHVASFAYPPDLRPVSCLPLAAAQSERSRAPMHVSPSRLLLIAAPAVAASMAVLTLGQVGRSAWIIQVLAICLACAIGLIGARLSRHIDAHFLAGPIILVALVGTAAPLLGEAPGPERWVSIGPVNLYTAPALLPAFLVACSVSIGRGGRAQHVALTAIVGASVLLAAQPDASQGLALLLASALAAARSPSRSPVSIVPLALSALATVWAFAQPDPLRPVPHVEGVFALALGHSPVAGVAVIAGAAALVGGLVMHSSGGRMWASVVAVYHAVLFACSVAGLTPAPIIGYGAGPVLGFGLMVAAASGLDASGPPNPGSARTTRHDAA
jgi:hypothetical protein